MIQYTRNRELSWLTFNERVLLEGTDSDVPLFERLKFVAIFSNNLSEFFMIRVGGLHDLTLLKRAITDNKTGMTPSEQLAAIYEACVPLYRMRDEIFSDIESQLWNHDVRRYGWESLSGQHRKFAESFAENYVLPILSPQIIDPRHPFPHLENGALYIAVHLGKLADDDGDKTGGAKGKKTKHATAKDSLLGIIPIPRLLPRVLFLPGDCLDYILVEEVISHYAQQVFSMYTVTGKSVISVTRNADINPDDETYDDDDYRLHMRKILKKRKRLAPVRLESQGEIDPTLCDYLCTHLDLTQSQVFTLTSPIDLSYVFSLEEVLPERSKPELLYTPFTPQYPANLNAAKSMIEQVKRHDVLLSYPYESMEPFLQLIKEAALDARVISIKITLYRLASTSRLAEYLISAAENGKEVTILLELRARFDEENNIGWAERFEEAGCTVLYGFEGYKVHSKICLITRSGKNDVERITQLSTGNYNEKTATSYTDLSLMTADPAFGEDAATFFRNMAMGNLDGDYSTFWVSPTSFKSLLSTGIDREIEKARAGESGALIFKMNSLTDKDLINKLVEASQAGVDINLIIRGICCLVPGLEDVTDNITVTSVVGRMLEHSRIYCFGEDEDCTVYLSSADLMTRNTERRVEIAFPLFNKALRMRVLEMLKVILSDTAKARRLLPDGTYVRIKTPEGSDPINEQVYFMDEAIQRAFWTPETATLTPEDVDDLPHGPIGFFSRLSRTIRCFFERSKKLSASQQKALEAPLGSQAPKKHE